MWRKKKIIIPAVAVLAALVGGGVWMSRGSAKRDPAASGPATATVTRGDVRLAVACTGRVVANLDVDIKCKASGEITRLPFDISDEVKKGDLLLELDPVDEKRVLSQAQVELAASQARLAIAQRNLAIAESDLATGRRRAQAALESAQARAADSRAKADRMKQLLAKELCSQEDCDTAVTSATQAQGDLVSAQVAIEELKTQEDALELKRQDIVLAQTQVDSNTIALTQAQDRLADTKVISPIDGVVVTRNVQVGQIIASGVSNVGGGTTVLTLSDLSHLYVLASVDESDIGKVAAGQEAIVTADAFPGRIFDGKIVRIATRGVTESNVVTFEVKIEVTGRDRPLLRPEMTANVEIVAAERSGVLTVPSEAVVRKGRQRFATVVKGAHNEERAVEIGISDGLTTEVVSGLNEGETVQVHAGGSESRWSGGGPGPSRQFRMMRGR
ncbi:MAG: efflux RND transporter periplasmic adaptor subunit [Phycisphaerae bacterium]|nr:efflux RND transporter periplasmic adaptor subunit [Phycisphaerae bacterium]